MSSSGYLPSHRPFPQGKSWGSGPLLDQLLSRSDSDCAVWDCIRNISITFAMLRQFVCAFSEEVAMRRRCFFERAKRASEERSGAAVPHAPPALVALVVGDGLLVALAESACLLLGIPFFPQSPRDPPRRQRAMQARFRCDIVFAEEDVWALLRRIESYDDSAALGSRHTAWSSTVNVDALDSDVAYVITTSGSTGEPKGVVATRSNLRSYVTYFAMSSSSLDAVEDVGDQLRYSGVRGLGVSGPHSRVLLLSRVNFDPSVGDVATCLQSGALLVTAPPHAIEGQLTDVVLRANPTHVVSTPVLWQQVDCSLSRSGAAEWPRQSDDLVRQGWTNAPTAVVALGGEAMPESVGLRWAPLVKLYNIYGVTEVTIYQSLQRIPAPGSRHDDVLWRAGRCGAAPSWSPPGGQIPNPYMKVTIDPQEEEVTELNAPQRGEVILTGPQVTLGYYDSLYPFVDDGEDKEIVDRNRQRGRASDSMDGTLEEVVSGDTNMASTGEFIARVPRSSCAKVSPFSTDPLTGERRYRTGDIGLLAERDNGNNGEGVPTLHLCGRKDNQVKIDGQRVALDEIEQAIVKVGMGRVKACCCCVTEIPSRGEKRSKPSGSDDLRGSSPSRATRLLCAWCSIDVDDVEADRQCRTTTLSSDEVLPLVSDRWQTVMRAALERYVPSFMLPSLWLFSPTDAPIGATGKVDRATISTWLAEKARRLSAECGEGLHPSVEVPNGLEWKRALSALGRATVVLWGSVFNITLTRDDINFFLLGGDSLGALKITRALYRHVFGDQKAKELDNFGTMPYLFQAQHLYRFPVLRDYVRFLDENFDEAWKKGTVSTETSGVEAVASGVNVPILVASDKEERHDDVADEDDGDEAISLAAKPLPLDDENLPLAAVGSPAGSLPLHPNEVPKPDMSNSVSFSTIVMDAVQEGDAALVEVTLRHGLASCDGFCTRSHRATTPLHVAVAKGDARMVHLLVSLGAQLTAVNADGVSPAHIAAMRPESAILRIIIANGFPCGARDWRQQSLLHVAARFGSVACIDFLVHECRLSLTTRDCWQRTPLHWAVLNGHLDAVRFLSRCSSGQDAQKPVDASPPSPGFPGEQIRLMRGSKSTKQRSARLARRRTHLVYETVHEIAVRLYGPESDYSSLTKFCSD